MKIAVISAILEKPSKCNSDFNEVVSTFRGSIKGRMGIPLDDETSVISIVVVGSLNEINSLTGRLGNIEGVTVKTAIGKKETMISNNK
ncbi:MAG: iron-only hydrogenase system regulator [Clostridium sp.]|uniref:TM1266 family iron-only hydrogenase system putative regulator n=1 Tax=Clostridium sp. TaxID=1506 RepID=UPI0025B9769A|nr:TM1266 family iron-only hydrogenase system putative regulator [Clostridium sp.]MCF0148025.1 iron-only hydrogenase system regulator [Clostridium sp.]